MRVRKRGSLRADGSVSFSRDVSRHVPERREDEVGHPVVEDRRLRIRLADDDAHRKRIGSVIPDVEPHFRDVDEDVRIAEIARQPSPSLHVQLDLPDARFDRHVHLGDHRRSDDAVVGETVPALESLDGFLQVGVVHRRFVARHRGSREVAGCGQSCREGGNQRTALSRLQFQTRRHSRPAAA